MGNRRRSEFEHQHGYIHLEKHDTELWLKPYDRKRVAFD